MLCAFISGIKRFGCDICGRHFMQKAHLQSHQATHTKVKAAQCKFCSKRFVRSSDMRKHELKHTKAQTHACQLCSKTFHRPELLRRHKRSVHDDERNYMCERCSKTFHTKYKLTRHSQSCSQGHLHRRRYSQQGGQCRRSNKSPQLSASASPATESPSVMPALTTNSEPNLVCGASLGPPSEGVAAGIPTSFDIAATTFAVTLMAAEASHQAGYCSASAEGRAVGNSVIMGPPAKGPGLTVTSLPMLVNSAS